MSASAKRAPFRYPHGKCRNRLRVEQLENRTLPSATLLNVLAEPALGPPNVVLNQAAFTPSQIRHAYGFDQISFATKHGPVAGTGAGQTIAIVDAYDDPNIVADLQVFDQTFRLPAANVTTGANPFPADTGYVLATGIGTPIANIVVRDLVMNNHVAAIALGLLPVLPFANFVMTPFSFIGSLMPAPIGSSSAMPLMQSLLNSFGQPSTNGMGTGSPLVSGTEPTGTPVQGPISEVPALAPVTSVQGIPLTQSQPTYILLNSNLLDVFFNRPAPDTMPLVPPDDEPVRSQPPDQSAPSTDAPTDLRSGQKHDVAVAKSAAGASDDGEENEDDDWFWDGSEDDWTAAVAGMPDDQATVALNPGASDSVMAAAFVSAGLSFGALERRARSKSKACGLYLRRM